MEILYKITGVIFSVSIMAFSILFMTACFNSAIYEYKEAKKQNKLLAFTIYYTFNFRYFNIFSSSRNKSNSVSVVQ